MNGTPYWGENTFSDIRNLHTIQPIELTLEEIQDLCKANMIKYKVKDIYTLFLALAELEFLFILGEEEKFVSWCKDIRFNYRDREIFIPYYSYDTALHHQEKDLNPSPYLDVLDTNTMVIKFNYELKTEVINKRSTNYWVDILSLYDHKNKQVYTIELKELDLPLIDKTNFSIKDLLNRYTESAYSHSEGVEEEGWKKYIRVKAKNLNKKENRLRSEYGLPLYSEVYNDISYTDVRHYDYHELYDGEKLLPNYKPYWLRQYEFEAFLYCVTGQGLLPVEDKYLLKYKSLGVSKRFLTVKEEGYKPLVLKHYYKDSVLKDRRKSFERYREG